MFPLRAGLPLLPTDSQLSLPLWSQLMLQPFAQAHMCQQQRALATMERNQTAVLTTSGVASESNRIAMKTVEQEIPTCDAVPGLMLLQLEVGGRRFATLICVREQGMDPGENLKIPSTWLSILRIDSTGNLQSGTTTRRVNCGEEIVLQPSCDKKPSPAAIPLISSIEEKASECGFSCQRCGKVFTYSYYRDKHLKYTRCVDNGDRKFPCPICSRSFEKRDRLRIHVLHVHENHRPHCCTVCGKAFSQSSSLNKHLRVHSGERPYACPFCPKAFTASSILRTHIRQHSGEKPFKCAHCGKAFASHAAHDSHVRRTHVDVVKKTQ